MRAAYVPWTGPEVIRLKKLYPEASRAELEAALPRHRWVTITSMASNYGIGGRRTAFKRKSEQHMLALSRAYFRPVLEGWGEQGKRAAEACSAAMR